MSLAWREQLSVGNDIIDSDHRYLIDLVNRIELCLDTKDAKKLQAALNDLSKYSQEHFAREEKIAHAAGYQDAGRLSLSHEILFRNLDQTMRRINEITQEWKPEAIEHLVTFLRSWLIEHVIKEDLLMKPALQKCPASLGSEPA